MSDEKDEARRAANREKAARWRRENPEKAKAISQRSYDRNKDKMVARTKKWRDENPDKVKAHQKERWASMTPVERDARKVEKKISWHKNRESNLLKLRDYYAKRRVILLSQCLRPTDACNICGKLKEDNGNNLAIDHCHVTDIKRSVLCRRCNTVVGSLNEDPVLAQKVLDYIIWCQSLKKKHAP